MECLLTIVLVLELKPGKDLLGRGSKVRFLTGDCLSATEPEALFHRLYKHCLWDVDMAKRGFD